jgi:hypothetical protein
LQRDAGWVSAPSPVWRSALESVSVWVWELAAASVEEVVVAEEVVAVAEVLLQLSR